MEGVNVQYYIHRSAQIDNEPSTPTYYNTQAEAKKHFKQVLSVAPGTIISKKYGSIKNCDPYIEKAILRTHLGTYSIGIYIKTFLY